MRFLAEWLQRIGLDFDSVLGGWSYSVLSCGVVMIEGQRGLVSLSDESVIVRVGDGMMEVTGEHMSVDLLSDGILAIKGDGIRVNPDRVNPDGAKQ